MCVPGIIGRNREIDIDECESSPCNRCKHETCHDEVRYFFIFSFQSFELINHWTINSIKFITFGKWTVKINLVAVVLPVLNALTASARIHIFKNKFHWINENFSFLDSVTGENFTCTCRSGYQVIISILIFGFCGGSEKIIWYFFNRAFSAVEPLICGYTCSLGSVEDPCIDNPWQNNGVCIENYTNIIDYYCDRTDQYILGKIESNM